MRYTILLSNAEFDPGYNPRTVQDFGPGLHPAMECYSIAILVDAEMRSLS